MSTQRKPPQAGEDRDQRRPDEPAHEPPGSNAVEHEPDPAAKPIPDGEHKYIRRSPYTAGND